jgi:hypothetical protein
MLSKLLSQFTTHRAALIDIGNTFSADEKFPEGVENSITVIAEVEVVVGENVDDVVDDWLVDVFGPPAQYFMQH